MRMFSSKPQILTSLSRTKEPETMAGRPEWSISETSEFGGCHRPDPTGNLFSRTTNKSHYFLKDFSLTRDYTTRAQTSYGLSGIDERASQQTIKRNENQPIGCPAAIPCHQPDVGDGSHNYPPRCASGS